MIGNSAPRSSAAVVPNDPDEGRTSGRIAGGMSKMPQSSALQACRSMSNSSVRLAFVGSVACTRPPVSRQIRNVSTVPNRISPAAHRSRRPGIVSTRCTIFVAEKYGSSTSPVRRRMSASSPRALSRAHTGADTRLCQTMAGATGRPVARSQRIVVSRWLVIPIAATAVAGVPDSESTRRAQSSCVRQMSSGSCSTMPRSTPPSPSRVCCENSSWAVASGRPYRSKSMARLDVVP